MHTGLRPITSAVRDYWCRYDNASELRKIPATRAEHAARLYRRTTDFDGPINQRKILVMTSESQKPEDAYVYGLSDLGRTRYLRRAA
jgi:hypothetical protein